MKPGRSKYLVAADQARCAGPSTTSRMPLYQHDMPWHGMYLHMFWISHYGDAGNLCVQEARLSQETAESVNCGNRRDIENSLHA